METANINRLGLSALAGVLFSFYGAAAYYDIDLDRSMFSSSTTKTSSATRDDCSFLNTGLNHS